MKIALLNLPLDNNYGGNLQRYALMKVLQDMGHEVTHIQLRYRAKLKWYVTPFVYAKRIIKKYVLFKQVEINLEKQINELYDKRLEIVLPFYEKYIKHTEICYTASGISKLTKGKFDAFIVGSDQCWRKEMIDSIGWGTFLFDFISDNNAKRIAYGVSFGINKAKYDVIEKKVFQKLYNYFTAVSVREKSGLQILAEMGCLKPRPLQVLDPTLLLCMEDYLNLIETEKSPSSAKGKVFCYVLDKNVQIEQIAQNKASELRTDVVYYGLYSGEKLSIEMWLKSIYEAEYVITDSYHGTIFSVLFNKPFKFCGNERRGNDRIKSLLETLIISSEIDYDKTNEVLLLKEKESLSFLRDCLS